MVLYITHDGVPKEVHRCPKQVKDLLESSSHLKNKSLEIIHAPAKTLIPKDGLVYVHQSEFSVGISDDPVAKYFGSEDATTCHVIIMRNKTTGATLLAHLDHIDQSQLDNLTLNLFSVSDSIEKDCQDDFIHISVIGGYDDERQMSSEISTNLIRYLFDSRLKFSIEILAVGELNTNFTKGYPSPNIFGAAVELSTGHVFHATFPEHGPDNILRHTRLSYRSYDENETGLMLSIYNYKTGQMVIPCFGVQQIHPGWHFLRTAPDYVILQKTSTSPKVEPPYFAEEIRQCLKLVIENPDLHKTFFKDGKPRVYQLNPTKDLWVLTDS